jgi:tRNA (guanine37-N1)-methyltransferase
VTGDKEIIIFFPRYLSHVPCRMQFHIITIFPEIFDSYLNESLFKRAQKEKIISVKTHDLRDFTDDRHRKVDDRPFGGGPGMVLQIQPIYKAVEFAKRHATRDMGSTVTKAMADKQGKKKVRTILFSTRGKKLDARVAQRLAKYNSLILICGRYEGVDERVADHVVDEEISIGDYVLSGGELPALVVMEAVSRFIPGFLGKEESLEEVNGSFPTYSRPEIFSPKKGKKWKVPPILLSGDHKKIEEWRRMKGERSEA